MLLKIVALTFGFLTIGMSLAGFILMRSRPAEKIFPIGRPRWLGLVCWVNLTCAILAGWSFLQAINSRSLLIAIIVVLTASKFLFFYISYPNWKFFLILLWRNRPALSVILGSSFFIGVLMVFTAGWIL